MHSDAFTAPKEIAIGSSSEIAGDREFDRIECFPTDGSASENRRTDIPHTLLICSLGTGEFTGILALPNIDRSFVLWRSSESIQSDEGEVFTLVSGGFEMHLSNAGAVSALLRTREPGEPERLSLWRFYVDLEGNLRRELVHSNGEELLVNGSKKNVYIGTTEANGPRYWVTSGSVDGETKYLFIDGYSGEIKQFPENFLLKGTSQANGLDLHPVSFSFPDSSLVTVHYRSEALAANVQGFARVGADVENLYLLHGQAEGARFGVTAGNPPRTSSPTILYSGSDILGAYFLPENRYGLNSRWRVANIRRGENIESRSGLLLDISCDGSIPPRNLRILPNGNGIIVGSACVDGCESGADTLIEFASDGSPRARLASFDQISLGQAENLLEVKSILSEVVPRRSGVYLDIITFEQGRETVFFDLCSDAIEVAERKEGQRHVSDRKYVVQREAEFFLLIENNDPGCLIPDNVFRDSFKEPISIGG